MGLRGRYHIFVNEMMKLNRCTRAICKFFLTHVGITVVVFVYCVVGGYIFEYLEKKTEEQICHETYAEYKAIEDKVMKKIYGAMATVYNTSVLENHIKNILEKFRDISVNIEYDGTNCTAYGEPDGPIYKWSFSGAFFFCVSVISTIGYGHIAPKTVYGRWVCIVYAILGIPLFLTWLSVVGDALSLVFRYIYTNACCFGWCDRNRDVKTPVLKQNKYHERRNVKNRSFSGDMIATRNENKQLKMGDIDVGNTDLPLAIVVIVLLSNITAGALLFGYWENWDMMQSIYFAFVTLTTIGFGDVTPGTDFKDPMAKIQLALGGIFMLVGLAVVAMCFALIQDQIVIIARQIGKKLGIVDENVD